MDNLGKLRDSAVTKHKPDLGDRVPPKRPFSINAREHQLCGLGLCHRGRDAALCWGVCITLDGSMERRTRWRQDTLDILFSRSGFMSMALSLLLIPSYALSSL
ncbi:hypothetical protein LY78DRAFT_290755 [Colletotrichum sublineola]|nr:hypothetical protein LY78DRAFT_290755 [Colletotrichum sublineola]